MGGLNSTLTSEQVITGGAVAVTIAVSALAYAKKPDAATSTKDEKNVDGKGKKLGKNASKKRKGKSTAVDEDGTPAALAAPFALFESTKSAVSSAAEDMVASTGSVTKSRTRKRTRKAKSPNASVPAVNVLADDDEDEDDRVTPEPMPQQQQQNLGASSSASANKSNRGSNKFASLTASQQVSTSPAMDASWTHVDTNTRKKRGKAHPVDASFDASSDAGMGTSSVTGDDSHSSSAADDGTRLTLAEQFQAKAPKTAVDDMMPAEELARVMRVMSQQDADDMVQSTDADADEDGWGIVRRKRAGPSTSSATPVFEPPAELTKDQRKREAKKEAAKQTKADAEADRLQRLAQHKKAQEKIRLDEIERLRKITKGGKISGGMNPVVQHDGRMVWE